MPFKSPARVAGLMLLLGAVLLGILWIFGPASGAGMVWALPAAAGCGAVGTALLLFV